MLVQQYLVGHSLADLEAEHGVKGRVCGRKVSLNYDQIEAKDDDPLAQECRGLILAPLSGELVADVPLGPTKVLARPFTRFFNLGQGAAAPVDMESKSTHFYEKMDGTLTILYFDSIVNKWHVATRAVAEADLPIDGFGDYTFRALFERAVRETTSLEFEAFVRGLNTEITYLFELTTPLNRIGVVYEDFRITLLGARDRDTGAEHDPIVLAGMLGVPHPKIYRFGNTQEMVDFVSSHDAKSFEGVVVCDAQFRRVKVKNPAYVAMARIRDSVLNSPRGIVELILLEKLDDAIPYLPEHIVTRAHTLKDAFGRLLTSYRAMWDDCRADVAEWNEGEGWRFDDKDKEHRKHFALAVQARKGWMAPLMDQYQGRCSGLVDWIMRKRQADGGWSNGFLDSILDMIERS